MFWSFSLLLLFSFLDCLSAVARLVWTFLHVWSVSRSKSLLWWMVFLCGFSVVQTVTVKPAVNMPDFSGFVYGLRIGWCMLNCRLSHPLACCFSTEIAGDRYSGCEYGPWVAYFVDWDCPLSLWSIDHEHSPVNTSEIFDFWQGFSRCYCLFQNS